MAPQDEREMKVDAPIDAEPPKKEGGGSYWDAPAEEKLDGKTLSTLDLSSMTHQHEDDAEKEREDQANEQQESSNNGRRGSYWEWTEGLQRTLSKLRITDLISQTTDNSEPTEPSNFLQRNSSGSALKDSNTDDDTSDTTAAQSSGKPAQRGSYWFWRNASLKNLSNASLTSLENAARGSDKKEGEANTTQAAKPSYWFWRNSSMRSMSSESLETMEKTARESDRMEGKEVPSSGPLTNLQHRMRTSWRKSFQQMSSNSLSQLSEVGGKDEAKEDLAEVKTGTELPVPQEHEGEEDEGALTF